MDTTTSVAIPADLVTKVAEGTGLVIVVTEDGLVDTIDEQTLEQGDPRQVFHHGTGRASVRQMRAGEWITGESARSWLDDAGGDAQVAADALAVQVAMDLANRA